MSKQASINREDEEKQKERLKKMLTSRFKFYCRPRTPLSREEHHKIADELVADLITNEWDVLKEHLEYSAAQGFYRTKEMWSMLTRARDRIGDQMNSIFPLPDAIVHALLDTGD